MCLKKKRDWISRNQGKKREKDVNVEKRDGYRDRDREFRQRNGKRDG